MPGLHECDVNNSLLK